MKDLELLFMVLSECVCVCVCVFPACLFALMKRFHLATVLVVGTVCVCVCVCVCVLPVYTAFCVFTTSK